MHKNVLENRAKKARSISHEHKAKKKDKMYHEKGCKSCGWRNKCNIGQKKIKCLRCGQIY